MRVALSEERPAGDSGMVVPFTIIWTDGLPATVPLVAFGRNGDAQRPPIARLLVNAPWWQDATVAERHQAIARLCGDEREGSSVGHGPAAQWAWFCALLATTPAAWWERLVHVAM